MEKMTPKSSDQTHMGQSNGLNDHRKLDQTTTLLQQHFYW